MKRLRSIGRRIYQSEIDLRLERALAHLLGWHTDGCRGLPCSDPVRLNAYRLEHQLGERWHRWCR